MIFLVPGKKMISVSAGQTDWGCSGETALLTGPPLSTCVALLVWPLAETDVGVES